MPKSKIIFVGDMPPSLVNVDFPPRVAPLVIRSLVLFNLGIVTEDVMAGIYLVAGLVERFLGAVVVLFNPLPGERLKPTQSCLFFWVDD